MKGLLSISQLQWRSTRSALQRGLRKFSTSSDMSKMITGAPTNAFGMNMFAIGCPETKEADIGAESSDEINHFITWLDENDYTLTKILQTHAHLDHVIGFRNLITLKGQLPLYIHSKEKDNWDEAHDRAAGYGVSFGDSLPDWEDSEHISELVLLDDVDSLKVGNLDLQVLFTPGHAPGHVCFYNDKHKVLFGGDLIFQGSIGRTDLPYCSPEDMNASLRKIFETLTDDVTVFPGHGGATTIGMERRTNPLVQQAIHS